MLNKLYSTGQSAWYWLSLIIIGFVAETIALYYQYALDFRPCVLCIHTRIWVLVFILVAGAGLVARHSNRWLIAMHGFNALVMAGLLERSYQLLGTERGWIFGSCDFDLGLPSWLALQEWLPSFFKVWESCGYTPELLFGITMAEALLVMSTLLMLASLVLAAATFIKIRSSK